MDNKMRIGLLGCGNIGRILAEAIDRGKINYKLVVVFDQDVRKAHKLVTSLAHKPRVTEKFNGLLQDTDFIVEAASQEAVKGYGIKIVESGKDMMIMSVGAFADDEFRDNFLQAASRNNCRIYIPSGAIAGLDGIKAARVGEVELVRLTTRKPPTELGVEVDKETVLYVGPAKEGISRFPKNVNVAAALSLVGVGFDRTVLEIIADPHLDKNVHEIYVKGEFGELKVRVDNLPSQYNPKTSYLAALSAVAMLKEMNSNFRVGV